MNILDVYEKPPEVPDMLVAIFERQTQLMEKYHQIEKDNGHFVVDSPVDLDDRFGQARLKDMAYRCIEEISEATNCLKNKPWKTTPVLTDRMHFYEEISDAFHFFVEFCLTAGIGPEELYTLYHKKNVVNQFRQASNY